MESPVSGLGGRGKKKGLRRTLVALEPEQVSALRKEAMARMVQRGVGRMDTGEVVRDAIDLWARVRPALVRAHDTMSNLVAGMQVALDRGDKLSLRLAGDASETLGELTNLLSALTGSTAAAQRVRTALNDPSAHRAADPVIAHAILDKAILPSPDPTPGREPVARRGRTKKRSTTKGKRSSEGPL